MILHGICTAYKDFGKSKIHFIGVDNMSTELPKNEKKNQKVLKVLHFEYISHPVGSKPC